MKKNEIHEFPSSDHHRIGYPYRVWLFSLVIAPLLFLLLPVVGNDDKLGIGDKFIYIIYLPFILIFLLPAGLCYILIFWMLINSGIPVFVQKIILAISGIGLYCIGAMITNFVFTGELTLDPFLNTYSLLFASTFLLLSLLLRIKGSD